MVVPVNDVIYNVWNPIDHINVLSTANYEYAKLFYESHADKSKLELWKIITTDEGYNEHIRIS